MWLMGLELWHTINGAPWLGAARLACTIKGASALAPSSSFRQPRLPVTIQHLRCLKHHLDLSNTFDAATWAVACVAFWCQCHLNKLCSDSQFDPLWQAPKNTPIKTGTTSNHVQYGGFFAPSTKTNPRGEWICWTDSNCDCSALAAFQNHCNINSETPPTAPLFSFKTIDGSWAPMSQL